MSEFVEQHLPCPCGKSSDAFAVNEDGWGTCFSCDERFAPSGEGEASKGRPDFDPVRGEIRRLSKRRISEETCRRFGYEIAEYGGTKVQVAPYRDAKGRLIAQKIRKPNKEFFVVGNIKGAGLFGQHLWKPGKRLVITEGEIDALSYAEITGCKWPVVSLPQGAASAKKFIKANLEFVESFADVILMFDNDDAGQKAAVQVAELLTPGKARIATLPLKDANDMLVAGMVKELEQAMWDAREHRPDGIINGAELWDAVAVPIEMGTPYPYKGLNDLLYGLRKREIVTLASGSGLGKSSVVAECAYFLANTLDKRVGYVALEEGCARTALRFMGLHLSKPIHLPGVDVTDDERKAAFAATMGTERYLLYDHFGSLDSDNLLSKLRYMVVGMGVEYLILDHLSIVVSGLAEDADERRAIDRTMTRLRSFTEETDASLLLVSHLKTADGISHEEGGRTRLAQLRGSRAIGQLSDAVIGLERNQQAEDEDERNTTIVRVLKNRYAGLTGIAAYLRYDKETGRLVEVDEDGDPEFDDESRTDDF